MMHALQICVALLASVVPVLGDPICSPPCQTDGLLFHTPIASFLSSKAAQSPAGLIWTDDGCSKSPDKPDGYNFLPGCQRHDFGYRNYKDQGRFTEDNRGKIDGNLKTDLYNECNKYSGLSSWKGVECRRIADLYYAAVRNFGNADVHIPHVPGF